MTTQKKCSITIAAAGFVGLGLLLSTQKPHEINGSIEEQFYAAMGSSENRRSMTVKIATPRTTNLIKTATNHIHMEYQENSEGTQ